MPRTSHTAHAALHPRMRRRLVRRVLAGVVWLGACAAVPPLAAQPARAPTGGRACPLTAAEQRADAALLVDALAFAHVGLGRYEPPATFRARADSLLASIRAPADCLAFFGRVAAFNARLRSGHLYTIAHGSTSARVRALPRVPMELRALGRRLYVWRDLSSSGIARGSEVLALNGRAAADVMARVWPAIPTDGFIETRQPHLLNVLDRPDFEGFDLYYALQVERPRRFRVTVRDARTGQVRTVDAAGITHAEKLEAIARVSGRPVGPPDAPGYELRPADDIAVLRIPRAYAVRDGEFDLETLLGRLAAELHVRKIGHLVVDLRGNTGGLDALGALLYGHLTDRPFRFYRALYYRRLDFGRFEPAVLPDERGGVDPEHPERYDAVPDSAGGGYWRKAGTYDLLDTVPAFRYTRTPFLGPVYVLVDGGAFSAGAQAATWLFDTRRALLVGEEAGGDYAGPDGGATMPIVLPHAQLHVRIPMIRSLQTGQPWAPGRGVRPHVVVRPTIADLLAGRDAAMEQALDLARRGVTLERFVAGARVLDDAGAR
jgi:hypothetical protein